MGQHFPLIDFHREGLVRLGSLIEFHLDGKRLFLTGDWRLLFHLGVIYFVILLVLLIELYLTIQVLLNLLVLLLEKGRISGLVYGGKYVLCINVLALVIFLPGNFFNCIQVNGQVLDLLSNRVGVVEGNEVQQIGLFALSQRAQYL